ncbi:MAG: Uma2 family endonuclease [Prochloraceae cyanobacterium]|nr:Uma2 family endonuclease [Prochloraceae cyanobacterium]
MVWVSTERLKAIEDEAGHLTGAPELVVEVLSPGTENFKRDRETKLQLYSITGVMEYWLVERFKQLVDIYRRREGELTLVATLLESEEITSPLLPDFHCLVQNFF